MTSVAEEVRNLLSGMGFYSLEDIVGRTDLLAQNSQFELYIAEKGIDLTAILNPGAPEGLPVDTGVKLKPAAVRQKPHIDEEVMEEIRPAIMTHGHVVVRRTIRNTDRAIGTRLSGELAFLYGGGHYHGNIQYQLRGAAGQGFGAFLTVGIELRLRGVANDYVGKGLSGGRLVIYPPKENLFRPEENIIIGNTVLYGAIAGECYFRGVAGERFAVRNSGAIAVIEGVGDHGCEYMTGGCVVVLGPIGRNFAAGMSGGIAYVLDEGGDFKIRCNLAMVEIEEIAKEVGDFDADQDMADVMADMTSGDERRLRFLIERHMKFTGSTRAREILNNWQAMLPKFVKVMPVDYRRALTELKNQEEQGRVTLAAGE